MNQDKLVIIWSSGDREVALKVVFMYTFNAKKFHFWDDVELIVWGPSAKLLSEDDKLQKEITRMKESGIKVSACKACTDAYKVTSQLEDLGITVVYMGRQLTKYLKEDRRVITF